MHKEFFDFFNYLVENFHYIDLMITIIHLYEIIKKYKNGASSRN